MTERLKEQLQRLGDEAPELRLPSDAWAQGRRARHRDHLLTGLLLVVVVALAGTLLRVTPASRMAAEMVAPRTEPADGVPDRLRPGSDLAVAPNLAVGVTSVVYVDQERRVVAVAADRGSYRLLPLPRGLTSPHGGAVALDRSGTMLAYTWMRENDSGGPEVLTGFDVADLTTGRLQRYRLNGRAGIDVTDLVWSPQGRWLAWRGLQASRLSSDGVGVQGRFGREAIGRLDLTTGGIVQERLPAVAARGITVDEDGVVWVFGSRATASRTLPGWARRPASPPAPENLQESAPASPNGRVLLLGEGGAAASPAMVVAGLPGPEYADLNPQFSAGSRASARTVGWIDDSHALVQVTGYGDREGDYTPVESLSLAIVDIRATSGDTRQVTHIDDPESVRHLEVATDLMTLDRPTVSRPGPWSFAGTLLVAGLSALVLALAVALVVRRRRLPRP
ncbi:hypothetical protein [Nocardioides sp.]|uniref:hypothetical protein n=1 Tax=Nocardioides sp. TaxID=35761 RepID=UPI003528360A